MTRNKLIQLQKKSAAHLISAYNQMMADMREAFEQVDASDMSLQKALNLAKHQSVHTGEVTAEEAHEIGEYIKRDINDAAEFMMESSAEFYDWLMLDIEMVERKVMELFLSVADHTRIELEQFKQVYDRLEVNPAEGATVYRSGEITAPGNLICNSCGTSNPLFSSSEIQDCKHCGHHRFSRQRQSGI
jgi:DNA-directed RNA polymerase subunit RPC12/RpoP